MDLSDRAGRLKRGYCALLEPEAYSRHVKLEHHSGLQQVLYNRLVGLLTQDGSQVQHTSPGTIRSNDGPI